MPVNVTMPALSPTMTEGTLARWLKKEGDTVAAGDVIAEIETDKATMEVEAVDEGVLGKILVAEGTEGVAVNAPIAVLLEEGESAEDIGGVPPPAAPASGGGGSVQAETEGDKEPPEAKSRPARNGSENREGRIFASPLAKRLAKEKGIDLASLRGSGPKGRIVKADIENAPKGGDVAPLRAAAGPDAKKLADLLGMKYTLQPNSNVRKTIASRLLEAKQTIPHFYLTVDCALDNLLEARRAINEKAGGAYKLSVNDFIIKACAMALKDYPAANVAWSDTAILRYERADISVAVATPNGLITPVIKGAEDKSLPAISAEIRELAGRAREGKLKPEEFQGGTFSLSNLGMYGIRDFAAIINPPQSCILAVGAGEQRPVVKDGAIQVRTLMTCTLSIDHRAVDGAAGAEFLQIFRAYIENPVTMLV